MWGQTQHWTLARPSDKQEMVFGNQDPVGAGDGVRLSTLWSVLRRARRSAGRGRGALLSVATRSGHADGALRMSAGDAAATDEAGPCDGHLPGAGWAARGLSLHDLRRSAAALPRIGAGLAGLSDGPSAGRIRGLSPRRLGSRIVSVSADRAPRAEASEFVRNASPTAPFASRLGCGRPWPAQGQAFASLGAGCGLPAAK